MQNISDQINHDMVGLLKFCEGGQKVLKGREGGKKEAYVKKKENISRYSQESGEVMAELLRRCWENKTRYDVK